jgi:kinetochore protein Spc25
MNCNDSDCFFMLAVLDCDPCLESSRELLDELNQTNDLFKFVRVMREMFQTLSLKGMVL